MRTNRFREAFPITRERVYLNNAASTPMSLGGSAAVNEYLADRTRLGAGANAKWGARCNALRGRLARFIGAGPEDVALTGGTSHGLSLVAGGLDWREGDEVIIVAPDFTANVYPWLHLEDRGVRVRILSRGPDGGFTPDQVDSAMTASTRLVAVTSTDFHTGFYADLPGLGELCRSRNVIFGVDAIQSLGVIPLDVAAMHIDFLSCGGHKWLLGTRGCGFLYISETLRERVRPVLLGWHSAADPGAYAVRHELRRDAGKYEPGAAPYMAAAALEAGLTLLEEAGPQYVLERVRTLTSAVFEGLDALGWPAVTTPNPDRRAGIVTFTPPGDPEALFVHLAEKGVDVSVRRGAVRVSPHFYNDEQDVDRLMLALGEWKGQATGRK